MDLLQKFMDWSSTVMEFALAIIAVVEYFRRK